MAKWLNTLLSGPVDVTVFRDGIAVDPVAVDATLSTAGGVVTLVTPDDEGHTWNVQVTPSFLSFAAPMRLSSISLSHPFGFDAASVIQTNAAGSTTTQVLTTTPSVTPDPAQFSVAGVSITLSVDEDES